MEENKQTAELLAKIEKHSRRQARFAAVQCLLTLVAAIFCAAGFYMILQLLPQVTQVLPQIGAVLDQMQSVLTNLEAATEQLAQIDLSGMVTGMDTLVSTAQESLNQTMGKLNTIDFATLNKAIEDLAAVVEPMSKILKAFS